MKHVLLSERTKNSRGQNNHRHQFGKGIKKTSFLKCIKKYDNRLQGNRESQYISNFWTHKHL